jgi:hypothetical protein
MTDERPISVAELLARSGGQPGASGRRRRHRPDGSNTVSVQELTGEIPVIRDDQPAPGSTTAEVDDAGELPGTGASEAGVETDAPASTAEVDGAEGVAAEEVPAAGEAAGPAEQGTLEAPAEVTDADVDAEATESTETETEAAIVEDGRGEGTDVDGAADVGAAEPEPTGTVEPAAAVGEPEDDHGDAERPVQAWSQWDGQVTGMATADFSTSTIRERAEREGAVAPESVGTAPDTRALSLAQVGRAAADAEDQHPDLEHTGAEYDDLDQPGADQPSADRPVAGRTRDADAAARPEHGGVRSWFALLAEVAVGLAAGAGLFYGFLKLWQWGGGLPTLGFATVLAFVVIIAIVTFTHYLRKTTDYLTLGLALLVGLVVTFVPLLMVLAE